MVKVITYGTFDLFHEGHYKLLQRAKQLGDYLIVAISTERFNEIKGKKAYHNYETRKEMLEAVRYVDLVIPEDDWDQKRDDVMKYYVDTVVMGSDWVGHEKFESLRDILTGQMESLLLRLKKSCIYRKIIYTQSSIHLEIFGGEI